jgi:hypothetical protein
MYRTITNYEDIKHRAAHGGRFEVTQLINSFLAVLAHPWDRLLDKDALSKRSVHSKEFRAFGFPYMTRLQRDDGTPTDDAENMLRLLRNSVAHGNMELLSRQKLRELRPQGAIPRVHEKEIAGVRIWNMRGETETWSTVLDITEMEATLKAMMRLCESRELWKQNIRKDYEQRHPATEQTVG